MHLTICWWGRGRVLKKIDWSAFYSYLFVRGRLSTNYTHWKLIAISAVSTWAITTHWSGNTQWKNTAESIRFRIWNWIVRRQLSSSFLFFRRLFERVSCHWAGPAEHVLFQADSFMVFLNPKVSNEKKPACLGYVRDYTHQLYRDYNKPL